MGHGTANVPPQYWTCTLHGMLFISLSLATLSAGGAAIAGGCALGGAAGSGAAKQLQKVKGAFRVREGR